MAHDRKMEASARTLANRETSVSHPTTPSRKGRNAGVSARGDVENVMGNSGSRSLESMKSSGWIDVTASGHVFVRGNRPQRKGTIACYDAGSREAAKDLVVFACVMSYDRTPSGAGIYAVPGFRLNEPDSILMARKRFERSHRTMVEREKAHALKRLAAKKKLPAHLRFLMESQ